MPLGSVVNMNGNVWTGELSYPPTFQRAIQYGDGLFETVLIRGGRPVFLSDHLERMCGGMEILGLEFEENEWWEIIRSSLEETLHIGKVDGFARARIQVIRQGGGAYLPTENNPGFMINITRLESDPWQNQNPLHLGIFHHIPITASPLTRIKTTNSLPYILGARHAESRSWDDALMRSSDGYLIESTRANIFVVHAASIFTPPVYGGCLPGIMRKQVLRALKRKGQIVEEKHLTVLDLNAANEVFLCNSIRGIMPVATIEETTYQQPENSVAPTVMSWIQEVMG